MIELSNGAARTSRKVSDEEHDARLAGRRNAAALERLNEALSNELEVPPAVTEIPSVRCGTPAKLTVEAAELARQVYFMSGGSFRDCARAIITAGALPDIPSSDTHDQDAVTVITGRLQNWWRARGWPKRPTRQVFMIRDANNDGGLYRSKVRCKGVATGNGPAPKGKLCTASPLKGSAYCWQHDPRERYVRMRAEHSKRLERQRMPDKVPLKPLADWLHYEAKMMLLEARERGDRVDPKEQGWSLLARRLQLNHALLCRVASGKGTNSRPGVAKDSIRAKTVVKYLKHSGVSFRDVYGFDPPDPNPKAINYVCPACNGPKAHGSKLCRTCHEAAGMRPCVFVKVTTGELCGAMTAHDSGMCFHCRRSVERQEYRRLNPRLPAYRRSRLTVPQLILATGCYLEHPMWMWVGERMWAVNAAGVHDLYKNVVCLASALAGYASRHEWTQRSTKKREKIPREQGLANVRAAHEALVREHGPVPWPDETGEVMLIASMIPFEPYRAWLEARMIELRGDRRRGGYGALAARLRTNPDLISVWIRSAYGEGKEVGKTTVRRAIVERSLHYWNVAAELELLTQYTFADLYGSGR